MIWNSSCWFYWFPSDASLSTSKLHFGACPPAAHNFAVIVVTFQAAPTWIDSAMQFPCHYDEIHKQPLELLHPSWFVHYHCFAGRHGENSEVAACAPIGENKGGICGAVNVARDPGTFDTATFDALIISSGDGSGSWFGSNLSPTCNFNACSGGGSGGGSGCGIAGGSSCETTGGGLTSGVSTTHAFVGGSGSGLVALIAVACCCPVTDFFLFFDPVRRPIFNRNVLSESLL